MKPSSIARGGYSKDLISLARRFGYSPGSAPFRASLA
jgi:hypothetical protein